LGTLAMLLAFSASFRFAFADAACAGAWSNSWSLLKREDRNTGCSELQPVKFTHSRKQDELAAGGFFNQEKSK